MKWSIGKKIGGGFGLALVILCIMGVVSYRSINQTLAANSSHIKSNITLTVIEELLSHNRAAVVGVRGYLLSGSESYLSPYTETLGKIITDLDSLRVLVADNPEQMRLIGDLEPIINEELK
ncbi:MAG: CHASE3 domain-containing protein, partial [Candidatus Glassbacteria bacterium]|nr:CHASE3 domain-containing protein [Candidatus Glassbacteria bacterium]